MRKRQTRFVSASPEGIAEAARVLREGGLVAFPTETVYGLGANALDAEAVSGIFAAKERPANDPIIVHIARKGHLTRVASTVPAAARQLSSAFWPGPLSLVLEKREVIPPIVTAGLPTVAVRMPAHPVSRAIIEAAGVPIAAPSANLFSRPSPTRPEHVAEDLGGRIDLIVDGGPTSYGLESTIVDLAARPYRLLRPGGLSAEAIENVLGVELVRVHASAEGAALPSPGLLETHYAPRTPLVLVEGEPKKARAELFRALARGVASGRRCGLLALEDDRDSIPPGVVNVVVGAWSEPAGSAERLFNALRLLDRAGLDVLYARLVADPSRGIGVALADRLRRASSQRIEV